MENELKRRLEIIQERIFKACEKSNRPVQSVRLIAVTKTHPVEILQKLIDLGCKDLGENRVQEIETKVPYLKGDFTMHMIGHLQTNKVSKVLPYIKWIQSIDREQLIEKIEKHHKGEKLKALLEVNTSGEASKSGCNPSDCRALAERIANSPVMEFCGLMTIGPLEGDEAAVRRSFSSLRKLGQQCSDLSSGIELSMGMSNDFEWAIQEGSTMVRIGSLLLGER
ncbi:MAG TPA: YggS family pyridoxal phosphate-dependent enzyme [Chitinispirillaceae bacterium]|nr:YggS family pyridoxal phosphate-dependent enzyme [Chitinispirillaceae bacterium]